jgi:hypothetical protein
MAACCFTGGLMKELDEALGLFDKTVPFLQDTCKGKNGVHTLMGLLRQSVFGRLAGYEDVNDAQRLSTPTSPSELKTPTKTGTLLTTQSYLGNISWR